MSLNVIRSKLVRLNPCTSREVTMHRLSVLFSLLALSVFLAVVIIALHFWSGRASPASGVRTGEVSV